MSVRLNSVPSVALVTTSNSASALENLTVACVLQRMSRTNSISCHDHATYTTSVFHVSTIRVGVGGEFRQSVVCSVSLVSRGNHCLFLPSLRNIRHCSTVGSFLPHFSVTLTKTGAQLGWNSRFSNIHGGAPSTAAGGGYPCDAPAGFTTLVFVLCRTIFDSSLCHVQPPSLEAIQHGTHHHIRLLGATKCKRCPGSPQAHAWNTFHTETKNVRDWRWNYRGCWSRSVENGQFARLQCSMGAIRSVILVILRA